MEDCKIVDCSSGLFVIGGKTDIIVSNSDLSCEKYCISVHYDVIGNIDLVGSTFVCTTDASKRHIVNCGPKCLVTLDGRVVSRASLDRLLDHAKHAIDDGDLDQMRLNKKAGVGSVICFSCKKVEPQNVRHKKCGRCGNACYCSKDCQVAHWPDLHREMCDMDVESERDNAGGKSEGESNVDG
uniref:MYND-type domain-containing protein n=1 Tax=Spumella elongata TaxID=89044 RepID=A0A7S3GYP1_9STRA|mmetsp:Transcript_25945/g.44560  ORF Transcript_25945/g.44560 Transcript_25945/m.44560 type:complete len:183 (+) Transcript_25945:322-870(+)